MIEYFNQMRADLLSTYKAELCEESVEAINNAQDIHEFVGLLSKFAAFLNYKALPTIEWVRQWFNTRELLDIAQENGVYVDKITTITDPTKPIVLLGECNVVITYTTPHVYQLTIQDTSKADILTLCNCVVRVRKKQQGEHKIINKHPLSQIKIYSI